MSVRQIHSQKVRLIKFVFLSVSLSQFLSLPVSPFLIATLTLLRSTSEQDTLPVCIADERN